MRNYTWQVNSDFVNSSRACYKRRTTRINKPRRQNNFNIEVILYRARPHSNGVNLGTSISIRFTDISDLHIVAEKVTLSQKRTPEY